MSHQDTPWTSRRRVLAGVGAGMVALAGCSGASDEGAENVPVLGDPDAGVTLEVFEDMACGACRAYENNGFESIESNFIATEQIRYEHRDRISIGTPSRDAANAAREVLEMEGNDAFWEFKSAVFDQQNSLRRSPLGTLESVANSLGFDGAAVREAADNRSHSDAVSADNERGRALGATATPSFVVDGDVVGEGANAVGSVAREIESRL
jgi:protein-disulfide isomerase